MEAKDKETMDKASVARQRAHLESLMAKEGITWSDVPVPAMARAAVYTRLARADAEGIARQRKECERLVRENGWAYDPQHDYFEDLGTNERSARYRMIANADRFDVIVAYSRDRLGRGIYENRSVFARLTDHGIDVVTVVGS